MISRELGMFYTRDQEHGSSRDRSKKRMSFGGGTGKSNKSPSSYRREFSRERKKDRQDWIDMTQRRS